MLTAQIFSVIIFIAMFLLIVTEKIEKHIVTLACGGLTLVVVFGICMRNLDAIWQTLGFGNIFTLDFWRKSAEASEATGGVDWATIFFIGGMMIMVEGMAKAGFFQWLCMKLAKLVHYKVVPIFFTFMILAAVLSMFIDSITVILFLAAVSVELSQLLKFDPVPMILAEIFCANLGGSATMCGDPPNIIVGSALGYSFFDFLLNTGLLAGISLIFIVFYFYLVFRKELTSGATAEDIAKIPAPETAISNKRDFGVSIGIFACAVVLLVSHSVTGLTVAFIGVVIAIITLILNFKYIPELLKKVDYKLLLFFIGLFIVVGGLEQTGILEIIANFIGDVSGGNVLVMVAIILWVSAIASAFVDNIPFAATMVPIIQELAATVPGVELSTLAWTLSLGTDIGGSATPIGASANVVGTSVAAKNGHPIGWGRYCAKVAPATVIVLIICMVGLFVRYC